MDAAYVVLTMHGHGDAIPLQIVVVEFILIAAFAAVVCLLIIVPIGIFRWYQIRKQRHSS